ncbi:MAG: hypothetical protein ACJ72M_13990 [Propionibacteriaceae bacterium]|jgi:hypothetical protein
MHQRTDLADGRINESDRLTVQLVQAADTPAFIAVNWPSKPTVATPDAIPERGFGDYTAHRRIRHEPCRS